MSLRKGPASTFLRRWRFLEIQKNDYSDIDASASDLSLLHLGARRRRGCGGSVEQTWTEAAKQIKSVVEKVVFPALDMILAIAFFVKLGGAYFDYRQRGQFEWTGPAILFACLIFSLIAPKYIWNIIGI